MLMLNTKRVLILGMARSGIAAAHALTKRGAEVTIYDRKETSELANVIKDLPAQVEIVAGTSPCITPESFDLGVISPGISLSNPVAVQLLDCGTPVLGEMELAYRLKPRDLKLVAITGTNGKTTTTALVADILARAGFKAGAAGNIGVPLISLVDQTEFNIVAVEVSSFQLETVAEFHPLCSAILNITPDHLDRHGDIEIYTSIKGRIFKNQNAHEYTILNGEDLRLKAMNPPGKVRYFSTHTILDQGIWVEDGQITIKLEQEREAICPLSQVKLRGIHNLENILCAVGITKAAGAASNFIRESLATFLGVRHRLEETGVVDDVLYVNDSKGTNPESTIKALESFTEPVVLIAGGRNKGSDFSELARLIAQKVKALVLVGEAQDLIRKRVEQQGFYKISVVDTFEQAVITARSLSNPGDVVLLSPACASWDMFNNYEERGDLFCNIVQSFKEDK